MSSTLLYQRRRSKIGLTALIDVVFILLMFFMLTSTFINAQQIDMKAPVAQSLGQQEASLVLAVLDVDGSITIDQVVINRLDMTELSAFTWYAEQRAVIVVPNAHVQMQTIVSALEQLKSLGIKKMTLGNAKDE